MAISSQYITDEQFQSILSEQNITGLDDDAQQSIVDRAIGDVEAELCERFVVPLLGSSDQAYSACPKFAVQKVLNAVYAKIRSILGKDKDRNIVVDATQRYIDLHGNDFKSHIKDLLNDKKQFGFKLNEHSEGSFDPVQSLGLARADNKTTVESDPDVPLF